MAECIVKSQRAVASFFGCHVNTVGAWMELGMPVKKSAGTGNRGAEYDLAAIARWLMDRHAAELSETTADEKSPELEKWRAIRRQLAQLELDKAICRVVLKADADSAIEFGRKTFLSQIASLRDELARRCPEAEADIARRADEAMDRVREVMSLEASAD